jgi:hypothetical protein
MASRRRLGAAGGLGAIAAIVAWLGWFQIAPALGFPTIGPAAMLNRVFLPHSDPGVWIGWILLVLLLALAAGLYWMLDGRGLFQGRPLFGLLFGVAAWAIAGLIVMPIIGHISGPAPTPPPPPGPPIPTTPDPMHATFMMLHLGVLAPLEALLAWLLFGAALGAALAAGTDDERVTEAGAPVVLAAALVFASMLFADGIEAQEAEAARTDQQVRTSPAARVLATGTARALPPGNDFMSVIELPQAAGATLGPHGHIPGFAYVLGGEEAIAFAGGPTNRIGEGQGGFMGALAVHSHENRRGQLPAGMLSVGLLVLGLGLVLTGATRWPGRRTTVATLTVLLIAGGALALWNPWANDWYFIGVRPASTRRGVMPLPNATRVYESADLRGHSPGPYTEKLEVITVPAGSRWTVPREPGAEMLLALNGGARVQINGGQPILLGPHQAAMAQQGEAVSLSNPGKSMLDVLSFSVTPAASGG